MNYSGMQPRCLFFIGKGGVGKSTISAITSIQLAQSGLDTLLVSMDPAHNQRDIFESDFSEKPARVTQNLRVKEVDVNHWVQTYLHDTQTHLKNAYSYQSAFNVQQYFNVFKYAPGLEEHALLLSFENTIRTYTGQDVIVFDMAPTALTLRFFSLPFITLIWLNELLSLRKTIQQKKEIISKIRLGKKEFERDRVIIKLKKLIDTYQTLRDFFVSDTARVNLIMTDDRLSFSEAVRIKQRLHEIGIQLHRIFINKTQSEDIPANIRAAFAHQSITMYPYASDPLIGLPTIGEYIDAHKQIFATGNEELLL